MAEEFTAQTSTGKIIAGSLITDGVTNGHQKIFHVRKEVLERSPVIKGWIEEPETMPQSLQKDGGLYFPHCDPEVVETLIRYMESDRQSDLSEYQIEFDNKITASLPPYTQDPIFYLRLYKLAGSLALERLCQAALRRVRTRKYDTETFVRILIEAEKGKLVEAGPVRDWMIGYMALNLDVLCESAHVRSTILEGGQKAWAVFSAVMSFFGYFKTKTFLLESGSSSGATSPYISTPSPSSKRSGSSPLSTRQSQSYIKSCQKSPSPIVGSGRVEKRYKKNARNLNPTVEDTME